MHNLNLIKNIVRGIITMKKNLTELVFIIDKSGSMSGLEGDTIGGFNSMLKKQRAEEGEAYLSTVLFDTEEQVLYDRVPIEKVPEMTAKDYVPGGCTALLDAMGGAIKHIHTIHKYAREDDRPEKTMFIIITDGCADGGRQQLSLKSIPRSRLEGSDRGRYEEASPQVI